MSHLGDPAGVVGDGAVGIHRHRDAQSAQHADGRYGDAVDAPAAEGELTRPIRPGDARRHHHHREGRRTHAVGDAGQRHRGRAGLGLPSDLLDGLEVVAREPLRDLADHQSDDEADDHGDEESPPVVDPIDVGKQGEGYDQRPDDGEDGGAVGTPVQGGRQAASPGPYQERTDDRRPHADGGDGERKHEGLGEEVASGEHEGGIGDRGHHRADVALEQVGAHAGDVADVVADVVGDDGRVARVVLGNARLDLADQVGADVGRLGVDAAADAGEQGDRGSPEPHRSQDAGEILPDVDHLVEEQEGEGQARQAQAGHRESHHRPAPERQRERFTNASPAGRFRGA